MKKLKRFILHLFILLCVFTGCAKQKPQVLFPISIDDLEHKTADKGWTVEPLEGYTESRSHFKLKKEDGMVTVMETLGFQEERFISTIFFWVINCRR